MFLFYYCVFFFFKQKTAYEMRISDWSSDVCSSDLRRKPTSSSSARIPARRPARPRSWESGRSPKENGWRSSGEPDARRYCNAEGAMPMSLKPELQAIHAELTDWRRDLHAHPATAFEEVRTADFVARKLGSFGIAREEPDRVGDERVSKCRSR